MLTKTRPPAKRHAIRLGSVGDAMCRDAVVTTIDTDVETAAYVLRRACVGAAAVVEGGRLVGMVTIDDVTARTVPLSPLTGRSPPRLNEILDAWRRSRLRVGDVMRTPVIAALASGSLPQVARVMTARGVHSLPVVDESGGLVGIISRDDVIEAVARAARSADGDERTTLMVGRSGGFSRSSPA